MWPAISLRPLLTPFAATILVIGLTALFAAIDFSEPGEINMSILYGLCVGICAWSQSPRFVWATAAATVVLTLAGLMFGPAPITGDSALHLFWADRTLVAVKLLILAAFVHLWIRRSKRLRATSALLHEKNHALSENLRQAHRMEAIGQLTGGIAHDFNNFLAVIIGNLEMIAAGRADESRRQRLVHGSLQAAKSATGLAQRLLAFSRPTPEPQVVHTDAVMRRMVPLWRRTLGGAVELIVDLPHDLWPCRLDPAQLEAAILNLTVNARDAMPGGGRLTIRASNATVASEAATGLSAGDYVLVSVSDNGPGIPADVLQKVFNPFFSTKAPGKGSGLGLWMIRNFADQAGGAVRIESAVGAGTTVRLYLPRAAVDDRGNAAEGDLGGMAETGATIPAVEGEERVCI